MIKRLAYKIVFNDLSKLSMYSGRYDAKNGNVHFQYGMWTVLEHIAYNAGADVGAFNSSFSQNMLESEERSK